MSDTTDARATLRTAERFEKGPSAMSAGEQAAAHAMHRTTDLTPEQAYSLARAIPHGVDVDTTRHMYGVTSPDGEPCALLGVEAAGVYLLIWTYNAGHSPQVALFVSEEDYAEAWREAEAGIKRNLRTAPGVLAETLAYMHGVERA